MTPIEEAVRDIVAREIALPPASVSLDASVRELPGVESIKMLRAVTRIEARFGIELDDEVVFRVTTIGDLAAVIERALAASPGAERRA
jgi:acyl carrier protein